MNIRPAEVQDLQACLALDPSFDTEYVWQMETSRAPGSINVAFRTTRLPRPMRVAAEPPGDQVMEHFERGEGFFVAEEADMIWGYLDVVADPFKKLGWIYQLTVAPERRRRGIGSMLMRKAFSWAHEQELRSIGIDMITKNYPACALAQKHGFVFCGFNERYYTSRDIAIFFTAPVR